MLLALIVGVGILVALNATVDTYERFYLSTISNSAGDYDLVITKKEIEPNLLIDVQQISPIVANSDPDVQLVVPRIQGIVDVDAEIEGKPIHGSAPIIALNRAVDDIGTFEVISGTLEFAPGYAVLLQETADTFGLSPGDTFNINYALPLSRQRGVESAADTSTRRARTTLTVSGIALQLGVTGNSGNDGVLVDLNYVQNWLGVPNQAERLVVAFDKSLYGNNDPQAASFQARALGEHIQDLLGETYDYALPRATIFSNTVEFFIFFQALTSVYGILSLAVVGLLVHTMVMTNVREQTRELALFRVIGSPRRYLFSLVAVEVAVLGVIGIGLGAILGQMLTNTVIVQIISDLANVPITDIPPVSVRALFVSIATAAVVLAVSAYAPARRAAGTKIMYAINPGVAEGLGLDDLAKMRERHVDMRIFRSGVVVLFFPALIFFVFPLAFSFGVLWLQAVLIFGSLLLLILGTALLFFPITLPMQRLLVGGIKVVGAKVGYFAQRNIIRSKNRNTLISLMIVISATLPTFFATTLALEQANTETDVRLRNGVPLMVRKFGAVQLQEDEFGPPEETFTPEVRNRFTPELLEELRADGTLGPNVAVSYPYRTSVRDDVGLRDVGIEVYSIDGNLNDITYAEGIQWVAGGPQSFVEVLANSDAVIISQGLSDYFERGMGDSLRLKGQGLDHIRTVRIAGVLGRFPGFEYTTNRTAAQSGDTEMFINEIAFRELTRDPLDGPYDPAYPIFESLRAAPNLRAGIIDLPEEVGQAAIKQVAANIRQEYGLTENIEVESTPESIETNRQAAQQGQVIILILTGISFILAIFGVFVVTYISVYTRRAEIAMLKAMGASNHHLFGMFLSEALVLTLSATLTGIVAGTILGYVFRYSNSFREEMPTVPAFDTVVTSAMLIMMIVAALLSTLLATWGYLRRKAIDIIRAV
jgi:ABC-type antimicrobial peptide transport system permease subunit